MYEFFYFPKFDKHRLNKFVKFENTNLVAESVSKNKGLFFLSGHYSDWELIAFSFAQIYNHKLNIIAKIQSNKKLNKIINRYRELSGNKIIEIGFSLKEIFKNLKNNEFVCFLVDQSAHPDYSVYINFFGKKVPAFSGPAKIALRQRPELIMAYGMRNKDFSYRNYFERIDYDDLIENTDENIKELTQRIQTEIENFIRKNPGQWLWFHKRFKHMKNSS